MKRTSAVLVLLVAGIALLSISCGTSDYVKSLTLSSSGTSSGGFYNLAGVDGTLQLQVTANYNSGKTLDVTNASTWTVVPTGCATTADDPTTLCPNIQGAQPPYALPAYGPTTVPISPTGLMTGIVPLCTWIDATTLVNNVVTPDTPPQWEYTGYYQVTATYRLWTSQPVGIGVGVTVSPNAPGCGPS